LKNFALNFADR